MDEASSTTFEKGELDTGDCVHCGTDLRDVVVEGVCPSCGALAVESFSHGDMPWLPVSRVAVASMIVGLVGVGGCVFYAGIPCGLAAMVMGVLPLRAIRAGEVSAASASYAKSGRSLGFCGFVLGLMYAVL